MNYAEEEKTIDLKELLYYVLKHWKKILLWCLLGVLLGSIFSLTQRQKTLDELDVSSLDTEKIAQYNQYQQRFEELTTLKENSAVLNMDPYSSHNLYKNYYLTLPLSAANYIVEQYNSILADTEILQEITESCDLGDEQFALKELIQITSAPFETTMASSGEPAFLDFKLSLLAQSYEQTLSADLMLILDKHVAQLNNSFAKEYDVFSAELLSESYECGYSSSIYDLQRYVDTQLKFYTEKITALENQLTADELFYHENASSANPNTVISMLKKAIKYAILLGALLCVLVCGFYTVLFLLDDHIKTVHEVNDYGLYVIACLEGNNTKKADWVERLFMRGKPFSHSRDYLLNALKVLASNQTVLCCDAEDNSSVNLNNWLVSQLDQLRSANLSSGDGTDLMIAKESEGAILFVRLWHTTSSDFKRQLEILRQINCPVKGVVVLHN